MKKEKHRPKTVTAPSPLLPFDWQVFDAKCVQNLSAGKASPEQQQHLFKMIVEGICQTYDLSYRPDSERDTAFAEGKRYVGLQLVKLLKINIPAFTKKETEPNDHREPEPKS